MTEYSLSPSNGLAPLQALLGLEDVTSIQRLERVDVSGNFLEDVTDNLVIQDQDNRSSDNNVEHTCTDTAPGIFNFTTDREFAWGKDIVRPSIGFILPRSLPGTPYIAGDVLLYRLGAYVVSSPDIELMDGAAFRVQAYDKVYLLMGDVGDTFSAIPNGSTTYNNRVAALMQAAGIPNVVLNGKLNPAIVNYSSTWGAKIIPSDAETRVWPCDDSNNFTFLEVINELLKASGCRPLYTDNDGKFVIEDTPNQRTRAASWTFDHSPDAKLSTDFMLYEGSNRQADVWNAPNRIVYIRSGLTFTPTEGVGKYTINNVPSDAAHYRPGTDQATIGRIITSIRRFSASSQADLVTQAEADYTSTFADAETFTIVTAPFPVGVHYDVFKIIDDNLPRVPNRKVEVTKWQLPLDGSQMTWSVRTVGDS